MNKYGNRVRELREKHNDTLNDLAQKLNMTFSSLGKYERGERKITPDFLEQVAKVYDVPFSYFFGVESEPPKELKEIGADWVAFAKDMKEKEITPDEIKAILNIMKKI
ncbi:helix-turn-helix transcriptional regulator [Bacillus sp. DTU_2020_1000418_1_SI_GHA_SEK_038]|uniref:helix-turn-helix domain-containing protein n=1 Tax=Bacillus sp. DTU_2020_1000418_1_SI_GHA_SEK_038 TaxID=3077585 RepID=UPI0028ECA236|nr:helix-turn-helix transcriptional regulator [Bacillus sp. DTU_2020_1000418_1_SI_GHA_SEK_038]WNS74281.1 helix-turn-helix transcriptional regulator [Bacillus sp. DTU_2020_1000418_1_SI_GHA_SEK_038]